MQQEWGQLISNKIPTEFPPSQLGSSVLLDPILQYFDTVKQLIFLLINRHSALQIPLAFPGIGGKMQEDPENETFTH